MPSAFNSWWKRESYATATQAHTSFLLDPIASFWNSPVASFLERQGFANVINLNGGIARWAEEVDLTMARY